MDEYGIIHEIAEATYDWFISQMGQSASVLGMEANFDLLNTDQQKPYFNLAETMMDVVIENSDEVRAWLDE